MDQLCQGIKPHVLLSSTVAQPLSIAHWHSPLLLSCIQLCHLQHLGLQGLHLLLLLTCQLHQLSILRAVLQACWLLLLLVGLQLCQLGVHSLHLLVQLLLLLLHLSHNRLGLLCLAVLAKGLLLLVRVPIAPVMVALRHKQSMQEQST